MFEGETVLTGAPATCPDCKVNVRFGVLVSGAGYHIGTVCDCSPSYSRESGYYATRAEAQALLDKEPPVLGQPLPSWARR